MNKLLLAGVVALIPIKVFAQTPVASAAPVASGLATPTGNEVSFALGGYNYVEPCDLKISIHGPKYAGEYTGTFALNPARHWFASANAKAMVGTTSYDGWCAPWLIVPERASPNGYLLDLGDY